VWQVPAFIEENSLFKVRETGCISPQQVIPKPGGELCPHPIVSIMHRFVAEDFL
jgi:hypothetical protein